MKKQINITGKNIEISDGYHTFTELYRHRNILFILLCITLDSKDIKIWKSKIDHRGIKYDDWFILGFNFENKQVSYHLPIDLWNECDFAIEYRQVPNYDGHSSIDVIDRLLNIKHFCSLSNQELTEANHYNLIIDKFLDNLCDNPKHNQNDNDSLKINYMSKPSLKLMNFISNKWRKHPKIRICNFEKDYLLVVAEKQGVNNVNS